MFYGIVLRRETGHAGSEGAAGNKGVSHLRRAERAVTRAAAAESTRALVLVTYETRH
jgi:hypothetical protein